MENPARAQRIVESIAGAMAALPVRTLLGTRDGVVTAVFSDTRRLSGWTAPQTQLAARIQAALLILGPSVLIGIGTDQPSTAFIPGALREAAAALDLASVSERVVRYSELPFRRLLNCFSPPTASPRNTEAAKSNNPFAERRTGWFVVGLRETIGAIQSRLSTTNQVQVPQNSRMRLAFLTLRIWPVARLPPALILFDLRTWNRIFCRDARRHRFCRQAKRRRDLKLGRCLRIGE
jgi:hypothetical protein